MSRLSKVQLLERFEKSLSASGVRFFRKSGVGDHPFDYFLVSNSESEIIRVYIWNLTHGGKTRARDEWRIQVTGIPSILGSMQFIPVVGGKTLILGWKDDMGVFAAFDLKHHSGPLGSSPSLQIREAALVSAHVDGLAQQKRGPTETAFAFRPEYAGIYIAACDALHASGSSESESELIDELFARRGDVSEKDIDETVPLPRRFAVTSTRRAIRAADFKARVLTAYSHRCAVCGLQLGLVEAAHIFPAASPLSTDETSNGIALCVLHHRAYDRGLLSFDTGYRTQLNSGAVNALIATGLDGGLGDFKARVRPVIDLPPSHSDRPHSTFITEGNLMRGWPA